MQKNNQKIVKKLSDFKIGDIVSIPLNGDRYYLSPKDSPNPSQEIKGTILGRDKHGWVCVGWKEDPNISNTVSAISDDWDSVPFKERPRSIYTVVSKEEAKKYSFPSGYKYYLQFNEIAEVYTAPLASSSIGFLLGCILAGTALSHYSSTSKESVNEAGKKDHQYI